MPRVIGIDPGTVSIDLCGLENGTVFLDRSFPTAAALADPGAFVAVLTDAGPVDLIAGPSGYGLPLMRTREATEEELRLAFLAAEGEAGGIGGLRALARTLARSGLPVVFTPGVIHLTSVPEHRKINRVDMGTADKVCVAALAIAEQAERFARPLDEVSLVLLELGGAFTAVIAVAGGKIVDGAGGSAGPLGFRAAGALDGEVAYLAGAVPKAMLFTGGAASVAGWDAVVVAPERFAHPTAPRERVAWDAFIESAVKFATAIALSVPSPREFVLSGRLAQVEAARYECVAADGYCGLDLVACATGVRVARARGRFSTRTAVAAARALECDAVVYEASFENHPRAVRALARARPLWGNGPAALARARDPRRLAKVAAAAGLPAPRLRFSRPPVGAAWLMKPLRSGGGAGDVPRRRVPFAIEGNPRYTAAMELVERAYGLSIFEVHARACAGTLPAFDLASARRGAPGAIGKAIVYARRPSTMGEARAWLADPHLRDVSPPGTRFAPRDPVCTVFAGGADATACHAALERRAAALYGDIERSEARIA